MNTTWCCTCGKDTDLGDLPIGAPQMKLGALFTCGGCGHTFARVLSPKGPMVWAQLEPSDVKFLQLDCHAELED